MHLENTQGEFLFHADFKYGPWDLVQYVGHAFMPAFADTCVMNYMHSIPHREQPSRYGQGLDAPIQISRLSLQNWCTHAEEVCFLCPCLLLCVCVSGERDVLIRAEFLIPGDRAAHPHELNNGWSLQRSSNPQLSKDRTVFLCFPTSQVTVRKTLTVQTSTVIWMHQCPAVCI